MKPVLFSESATEFTTNGIGRLDPISCQVTEERNGLYELEMTLLQSSNHADEIVMSSIILAKPNQTSDNQAFRVYKITKPINGRFKVYAQHISYQLSYIPAMPFTVAASSTACADTLAALVTNAVEDCPFSFTTDVTTSASYTQTVPASIRSRLGGVDGSVLDQFGGEYEWDNYDVILHENRGVTTPTVSLRYGKNITDLTQEEYISNTITGVVPYWLDSEGTSVVTLSDYSVDSSYADNYPFKRTVPLDCSQAFETAPDQDELEAYAQAYVNQSGIGIPTVSISVSFVNLSETLEYGDILALQTVSLCDKVNVYFEKLDISTTAKVVKCVYDVLAERYTSIEIGTIRASLAQTISDTNGAITTALDKAMYATKTATAWLTGSNGYVMAVKNDDGSWKELLFLDTNDAETATNVLRINENGIGFSSTGVDGPYTQAWTLDGKMVIGGTNAPSLTVYDDDENILFQISSDGMVWSADNSSMTSEGIITAVGAVLTDATITGEFNSVSGTARYIKIADGYMKGYIDGSSSESTQIYTGGFTINGTRAAALALDSNGYMVFRAPSMYVGTSFGSSSLKKGYTGNIVRSVSLNGLSVSTSTIYDYYGNAQTVVTGVSGGGGSVTTGSAVNGMVVE